MDIISIINKKKRNIKLTSEEISFAVQGYVKNQIEDYQMSALTMAILINGMDKEEISDLTNEFVQSGETVDLSGINGIKVDKHSTGGVGDKVTLILAPLAAAMGLNVAKMSGRGLGHTGGTIDKLETFKGFSTELSTKQFIDQINNINVAVMGQSSEITPADKKIYALRDVTGTVDSIPLIASSIMSKKIATGSDAICLDVKVGRGAFIKELKMAEELATTMVDIGKHLNKDVRAVLTQMDNPLGYAIGNSIEIHESIELMKGNGLDSLTEVVVELAANMGVQSKVFKDIESAKAEAHKKLKDGSALAKFKEWIMAQGGSSDLIDNHEKLLDNKTIDIKSDKDGFINDIDALMIGEAALKLGAGRLTKDDELDLFAGVYLKKHISDKVQKGEVIATLYSKKEFSNEVKDLIKKAILIEEKVAKAKLLIYKTI